MKNKEKNAHSTFSNIFFFIRLLFKISPVLVIGEFIMGILTTLPASLVSVLGLKYIIDVVSEGEKLERIFRLSIFPLHKASGLNELFLKMFLDSANSKVILNPELWKTNYEKYKDYNAYKLFGFNQHPFLIYHNDFFPSKITYGFAAKYYENSETSNIASLYFDIEISGKIHQYFKYKYYDI